MLKVVLFNLSILFGAQQYRKKIKKYFLKLENLIFTLLSNEITSNFIIKVKRKKNSQIFQKHSKRAIKIWN